MTEVGSPEFDIDQVLRDLAPPGAAALPHPDWVESSYRRPRAFLLALFAHAARRSRRMLKSQPFLRYDFYHDLVGVHVGEGRDAVVEHHNGAWHVATYDDLHDRCSVLSAEWQSQGVEPGTEVAIALPLGVDYVVSLLTCLRLGAVVSVVPGLATRLLRERIAFASTRMVVADASDVSELPSITVLSCRTSRSAGAQALSHTYASGELIGRLHSPFTEPMTELADVPADDWYIGALRDATLVLGLTSADRIAAPGFNELQYQPQTVLASLLAGATFISFPIALLETSPSALQLAAPRVLGVSPALLQHSARLDDATLGQLRLCFRSATETMDLGAWGAFESRLRTAAIPSVSLASSSVFGGSFAFSPKRVGQNPFELIPAPGEAWRLTDPNGSGQDVLGNAGLLTSPRATGELAVGRFLFGKDCMRFSFSGATTWVHSGRAYPQALCEAWVGELELLDHCVVYLGPGEHANRAAVILIGFVDPLRASHPAVMSQLAIEIRRLIERSLGAELVPDRIELFTTVPKQDGGVANHQWCVEQYLSGMLRRKQANPIFSNLSTLRRAFALMVESS